MSKKKDTENHAIQRLSQRYPFPRANVKDLRQIERKIHKNNFTPTPLSILRKEERKINVVYGIVSHKGVKVSFAFDKFENRIKTFLLAPEGRFNSIGTDSALKNILDRIYLKS